MSNTPKPSRLSWAFHGLVGFLMMAPPIAWAIMLTWCVLGVLLHVGIITRAVSTPAVLFTIVCFTVWLIEASTRDWRAQWRAKRAARRGHASRS